MKLKYYFLFLALGIAALATVALYGTFHSHPRLFYVTEGFVVLLLLYLWLFYQKTLRPYDTLVGGMELMKKSGPDNPTGKDRSTRNGYHCTGL